MPHDNPQLLLIETSVKFGQVGLARGEAVIAQTRLNQSQRNARDLVPAIQALVQEQLGKPGNLQGVVVSQGPGSYTGLRVGLMTAKTLCYTLGIPLITIPTFDIIARYAFQLHPTIKTLEVIADAQQDRLYQQSFDNGEGESRAELRTMRSQELSLVTITQWLTSLRNDATITGPGVEKVEQQLPATTNVLDTVSRYPMLIALAFLGFERYRTKQYADTMHVEPLYLRASSAEEQWTRLGK